MRILNVIALLLLYGGFSNMEFTSFRSKNHLLGIFSDNLRNGLGYSFYQNCDCYPGLWHNDKTEGLDAHFFGGQSASEMYRGDWKKA